MPIPNSAAAGFAPQAEPDAGDFVIIQAGLEGTGVDSGCACTPGNSGVNLSVAVAAGTIFVGSKVPVPVLAATVTPGAASGSNPRFDLIVASDLGVLSVVAGTAAANPVFPAIPAASVVLAAVWIPTSASSITASNIVDKRQLVDYTAAPRGAGDQTLWGPELRGWRVAWAKRTTAPVNVLVLGDSNTVGYWASSDAQRWIQVFASSLESACGQTHSAGWQPHHSITNYSLPWVDTGAITDNSLSGLGYGAVSLVATTGACQATQVCDRFWLMYQKGTAAGAFSVAIDGATPVTVAATAGAMVGGNIWDSGYLPYGSHTVKIAATTATVPVIEGIQWFQANGNRSGVQGTLTQANAQTGTGVRVFNGSKFGSTAGTFAAAAGGGTWWTDNLNIINPHVVLMCWGTNEENGAVAPATFRTNLVTIIDRINTVMAAAGLPAPSYVLAVPQGTGLLHTSILPYATAVYRAAADRGCAVIDRNSLCGWIDNASPAVPMLGDIYGLASTFDIPAYRSVNDGVLASNTTVTSATANFLVGDVGKGIVAAGIPPGTTITARASTTSITISQAATVSGSGVTLYIAGTGRKHFSDAGHRIVAEHAAEYLLRAAQVRSAALTETQLTVPPTQVAPPDSAPFASDNWLRSLRVAWANRNNKPVNIVVLGDSITQGYYATTFDSSIMGLLMARLCQANGQQVPAGYVSASSNSASSYVGRDWTRVNCTDSANYGLGYGACTLGATTGTASFTATADRIWVHYPIAPAGLGTFTITIDALAPVTITPTGTARSGRVWDSGPLTRGPHTVLCSANSATAAVVEGATFFDGNGNTSGSLGTLSAANADTGAGLRLWNAAHFAFIANNYAVSPNGTHWWTDGFDMIAPDVVFIVMGANDCSSRTVAQFQADLTTIYNRFASTAVTNGQLMPSVIIVSPLGVGSATPLDNMPPFRDAARQTARVLGCGFIDWYALSGYCGTAVADVYGLMSAIDSPTYKLHPTDIGHGMLGAHLAQYIADVLGPTGQLIRPPTRVITTAGRSVADGVLAANTTVTSATAAFVVGDVGKVISGIGIPNGTTITARASATSITISQAATVSATGVTLAITSPVTPVSTAGDDMIIINCAAADETIALPTPVGQVGQTLTFKRTDNSSNRLTLYTTGTPKVEDGDEYMISNDGGSVTLLSDGTNWVAV